MTKDLNTTGRWLKRLTQGLAPEPQDRKQLLAVLREAGERGLVDSDALTMLEGCWRSATCKCATSWCRARRWCSCGATAKRRASCRWWWNRATRVSR